MATKETINRQRVVIKTFLGLFFNEVITAYSRKAEELREPTEDIEAKLNALFGAPGTPMWVPAGKADAMMFAEILRNFNQIEKETESGPYEFKIDYEAANWNGEKGPDKLDNLVGMNKPLLGFLLAAGYKIHPESRGTACVLTISR